MLERKNRKIANLCYMYDHVLSKVCNHVTAVYNENKLQHYATVYRNHTSAGEKLGLFRLCKLFYVCFQQIHYSLFRNHFLTEQQHDLSVAGKQWLI